MEYRIASFNLRDFGPSAKNRDLKTIAEFIMNEELDVIALQEIFNGGKGVEYLLDELVKYELYEWDYCFNMPKGDEGYAYLWNKQRFKLVEYTEDNKTRIFEPTIINSMNTDVHVNCSIFARTPYYIRLEPLYGGFFELRLINIHIFCGNKSLSSIIKRNIEFDILTQKIYPEISKEAYGNHRFPYTIAMGDYNLNIFNPIVHVQDKNAIIQPQQQVYSYEEQGKNINICTVQDGLTTLKDSKDEYANNYDHFTYSPELAPFLGVSVECIDVINKYCRGDFSHYRDMISNHLPILMKINI